MLLWINQGRGGAICGLPIGNLTSQIFANIYLNELDQFVKHKLKVRHYFRYADDFVILHGDAGYLESILISVRDFLKKQLNLEPHPNKITIRKFRQGIDFLGYVVLPHHVVMRTKTKRRMFRKLFENQKLLSAGLLDEVNFCQSVQSYLGLLQHCNGYGLSVVIKNNFLSNFTSDRL